MGYVDIIFLETISIYLYAVQCKEMYFSFGKSKNKIVEKTPFYIDESEVATDNLAHIIMTLKKYYFVSKI